MMLSFPCELEFKIHYFINQQRITHGLLELDFDNHLSEVARRHSYDMAIRHYFAHETPEGRTPTDRGLALGYRCHKNHGFYVTEGIGENIFMCSLYHQVWWINGLTEYDWKTQDEIAQDAVEGWMNSPGHRRNILTKNYEKEGIGVAIIENGEEIYVTQNFC